MLKIIRPLTHKQPAIVQDSKANEFFCFTHEDWTGEYYCASKCEAGGTMDGISKQRPIVPVLWKTHKSEHDKTAETSCYEFGESIIYAIAEAEAYSGVGNPDDEDDCDYDASDGGVFDNEEELEELKREFMSKHLDFNIHVTFLYENGDKYTTIKETDMEVSGNPSYVC